MPKGNPGGYSKIKKPMTKTVRRPAAKMSKRMTTKKK